MERFIRLIMNWFPFALTISLLCGILFISVQQSYRHQANDPQFQMAENAVNALGKGTSPKALVPDALFELSGSLSPYLIIYDENGNEVASAIMLNGKIPKLPPGVLNFVKNKGEDVITWQPQPGIRQAMVIKRTEAGTLYFVAAGRSLKKTEERISMLTQTILLGWASSLGILFVALGLFRVITKTE